MIKEIYNKNRLLSTILLNVLFLVGYIMFFDVQYEQDDGSMAMISYSGDEHLVFINIIIGLLLKGLHIVLPQIAWYFWLEMGSILLSFIIITYQLTKRNYKYGMWVSALILLTFGYNAYVLPQFTKTAAMLSVAGFIIVAEELIIEEVSYKSAILSFAVLLLGFCYRNMAFFMVAATIFSTFIYLFYKKMKGEKKVKVLKICAINLMLFLLCFSTKYINIAFYEGDEWNDYKRFNSYRSTLLDYSMPDYEKNKELYDELDLSMEDVNLFKSWNIADPDVFSIEKLEVLAKETKITKKNINGAFFVDYIHELSSELMSYHWFFVYVFSVVCAAWFVKKFNYYFIQQMVVINILEIYLFYTGRGLLNRIQFGIFITLTVANFYILLSNGDNLEKADYKKMMIAAGLIILVSMPKTREYQHKGDYNIYALENEDAYHVYFMTTTDECLGMKEDLWTVPSNAKNRNYLQFGGWTTYMPFEKEIYSRYGIENMYEDMVNNDRIYLNDSSNTERIVDHIRRHYNSGANCVKVKEINGIVVYRIISDASELIKNKTINTGEKTNSSFEVVAHNNKIEIDGNVYFDGESSYQGNAFVIVSGDSQKKVKCMLQKEALNKERLTDDNGRYSRYVADINYDDLGFIPETVEILYEYNGELYGVYQKKLNVE